jgi:hypothetical protein
MDSFDVGQWVQLVTTTAVYYGRIWPSDRNEWEKLVHRPLTDSERKLALHDLGFAESCTRA